MTDPGHTARSSLVADEIEHSFIQTNGVRLHVAQAGPKDGPLLVLLHGFPEFWWGWRKQIQPLASDGYRLLIPDQRGYNLSDKPRGLAAYDLDFLAEDVIGLIQAVGRDRARVVGHDWGAAVAWHLATHWPERVDRLANLNVPHPAVMAQTLRRSWQQIKKSWYIWFFQIPWLPEWVLRKSNYQLMVEMLRRSGRDGTFDEDDFVRYREAWSQPEALTAMVNWYRQATRSGLSSTKRSLPPLSISVPTLLIWGARDVALSRQMAQASIDLCTEGRLVVLEEATHWVQHDEPGRVNQLLLGFLAA